MEKLIDAMRIDFDEVDISGCTDVDDIIAAVEDLIDAQPAVDAVEVVRCKGCKWYQESKLLSPNKFCYRLMHPDPGAARRVGYNYSPDDFCSYGERRTDHETDKSG